MAERHQVLDAIILQSRESGSGGRTLTLLNAEQGLVNAFLFGGGKSRLRSLASPWHAGRAWLYRDAAGFFKLSDFDPLREFPAIRASLEGIARASLLSEVLAATHGLGGDHRAAWELAVGVLEALDAPACDHEAVLRLFCVRVLDQLGLLPDPEVCPQCGRDLPSGSGLWYSRMTTAFCCQACALPESSSQAATNGTSIHLPPGAVSWLRRAVSEDFPTALRIGLAREAASALRFCLLDNLAQAVPQTLRSLSLL